MRRAVLLLGLALAACATTEGEPGAETRGTNTPTATETAPSPTAEPEPEPEVPSVPSVLPFGDTFTYEDGLVLTVGPPEPFEPTEYAVVEGAKAYVVFEVRVVNGTDAPFDPSATYATVQSGNQEATEIFDSGEPNHLEGPPQTSLLPGREAVWRAGFGVADPADIVLEITPSFEHESAIFQGGVS